MGVILREYFCEGSDFKAVFPSSLGDMDPLAKTDNPVNFSFTINKWFIVRGRRWIGWQSARNDEPPPGISPVRGVPFVLTGRHRR